MQFNAHGLLFIAYMKPRFRVEQKITPITNKYSVFAASENGQKTNLIAFAQQKKMAIKERVDFYSDDTKQNVIFSMRAEKAMDIHGRYLVEDPSGKLIGAFRKEFSKSLLKSTWSVLKNDNPVITVTESNSALAVLRRYIGFIPIVGEIADIVIAFFKYHFIFLAAGTQQKIGLFEKQSIFKDHYVLSAEDKTYQELDWRVWACLGVALDALQSR